jgi:hypothetical protein
LPAYTEREVASQAEVNLPGEFTVDLKTNHSHAPCGWLLRGHEGSSNKKCFNFDALCSIGVDLAAPVVREALMREVRESAETGATLWLNNAERMLQEILEDPDELEGVDKEALCKELSAALQGDLTSLDEDEAYNVALSLVRLMMSTWLELLREALSSTSEVRLSDDLLPQQETARPEFWHGLMDAIAPFAITQEEAVIIRRCIGREIYSQSGGTAVLPFNLHITAIHNDRFER